MELKPASDSSDVRLEANVAPRWAPNNSERNNEPPQILQQTIPVIARLQRERLKFYKFLLLLRKFLLIF